MSGVVGVGGGGEGGKEGESKGITKKNYIDNSGEQCYLDNWRVVRYNFIKP